MRKPLSRSALPSVLLLGFSFGTSLVVSRFSLGQFHPVVYVALRLPLAAAIALVWTRLKNGRFPSSQKLWLHGIVVGLFSTAAPMLLFMLALQYQSSGVTALFITLTPIASMLIGHIRLHDEPMTARRVIGSVIAFAGCGLLLLSGETGLGVSHWEGFVLVLGGVVCQGFGIVHLRKHLSDENSLEVAVVRLTVATVIVVPIAAIFVGFDFSRVMWTGVAALSYGTIFGTLLGFVLYSFLVVRFGPAKATQTEYLVPVFATIAGAIFLDERITLVMVVGMLITFAGLAIVTRRTPARTH